MNCRLSSWVVAFLALVVFQGTSYSQSPADGLALAAQEQLQSGNAKGAAEKYETLIKQYPTFEGIWPARLNLGFAYYLSESYEKAITAFKEVDTDKNPDRSIRHDAALYLAGVYASYALTPGKAAEKDKLLDESVKAYDVFLQKYRKESKALGDALYGKAASLLQGKKLDEAEAALKEFFRDAGQSSLKEESSYLMARVYSEQAKKFRAEKQDAEAQKRIAAAKELFDTIANDPKDLVLANDALISAGDIFLGMNAQADAIKYLRRVKSQQFIQEQQANLIDRLHAAKIQATRGGNKTLQDDLTKQEDRARKHLQSLQGKASVYLNAQQLISRALYEDKRFDEVLILNEHFLPHFDADQKKRALGLNIKALLAKKQSDKAVAAYEEYKKAYGPGDKLVEDIPIGLSEYFLASAKYDEAVKWAQEYKTVYTDGPNLEYAYYFIANAYTQSGKVAEAQTANDEFRTKYPKSALAGRALFDKANTNYQAQKYEDAIKDFQEYIQKFPDVDNTESAVFYIALSYSQLKKQDEVINVLKDLEKKFPKSKLLPNALAMMGEAYEQKKDINGANTVYARIVKEFPLSEVAPDCQLRIANNLCDPKIKRYDESVAACDQFIQSYPDRSNVPGVYLMKAQIRAIQGKPDDALAIYQDLISKFGGSDHAARAYVAIGGMSHQKAGKLASKPEKLPEEKKQEWKDLVKKSIDAYETVIQKYSTTSSVDEALSQLSLLWQLKINAKFATKDEAMEYFNKLGTADDIALKTKAAFTLGSLLTALGDKENALKVLDGAFKNAAEISLPNEGYKQYRNLLIAEKQYDTAITVSEKQLKEKQDSADDKGVADANLGLGQVYFEKNDLVKASACFTEIITKYPWYEPVANEAEFHLIWIEERKKNFEEAIKRYNAMIPKIRDPELKVRLFMRLGQTHYEWGEAASSNKAEHATQAIGYFLKIGLAFSSFEAHASEALYMVGVISEQGIVPKDPKTKTMYDRQEAIKYYKKCVADFRGTIWAEKAAARLKAIGQ